MFRIFEYTLIVVSIFSWALPHLIGFRKIGIHPRDIEEDICDHELHRMADAREHRNILHSLLQTGVVAEQDASTKA